MTHYEIAQELVKVSKQRDSYHNQLLDSVENEYLLDKKVTELKEALKLVNEAYTAISGGKTFIYKTKANDETTIDRTTGEGKEGARCATRTTEGQVQSD